MCLATTGNLANGSGQSMADHKFISETALSHAISFACTTTEGSRMAKYATWIVATFTFYFVFFVLTIPPWGSSVLCAIDLQPHVRTEIFTGFVYLTQTVSNYLVGVGNVVTYCTLLIVLSVRGKLSFGKGYGIRITMQAALVSVLEFLFFVYWEHFSLETTSEWKIIADHHSTILYYDVLLLPYLLFNR
ncbi:unnamed protein product [Cylicocyclus nassatus]|uniref:Uncharacterized protein n=1 Tax=Cylicocyclus nassatus TaxID=53992 RepID=A0AA36H531_CYLNA|nr:unnamed protein product [Cylicocyclus nassatus]